MSEIASVPDTRRRLSTMRTADIVAENLRRRIVSGELSDGDLLPGQKQMAEDFDVSLVSVREAMRILETERLLTVRRGKYGGAVVHAPVQSGAAYMLGLVLQSDDVGVADLAAALRELEPSCAALAAVRGDRHEILIPELEAINSAMAQDLSNDVRFTDLGRDFHHAIERGCGNHTMATLMASIEKLLISQEDQWIAHFRAERAMPTLEARRSTLNTHVRLTEAIADGDAEHARWIAIRHVLRNQQFAGAASDRPIDVVSLRAQRS